MKDWTRRAVAYIAGRAIAGRDAGAIYDYAAGKHFIFSGTVNLNSYSVYDHGLRCHITGNPPSLYHFGNQKHLTLQIKGTEFSGYDYDTGKHFSGRVNGASISLYDHDDGRHHSYSI